jgi:cysteine desulfurase
MPLEPIHIDFAVTTPLSPEVFAEMEPFFTKHHGTPSALNQDGLKLREAMDVARARVAQFIKADADSIYFTSSGTEAANLAVKGLAHAHANKGRHIIMSAVEHPSVLYSTEALKKEGFEITQLPVDSVGRIDPHQVKVSIRKDTILIATHLANHDLGTIQPIQEIAAIAKERGVLIYIDACAAAGWIPLNINNLDALSFLPHRFFGPKGAGILYMKKGTPLEPIIHGGMQERGLRAGTENVPAIVGAGKACELADLYLNKRSTISTELTRLLFKKLTTIPKSRWNGPPPGPDRLPYHASVSFEFLEAEALALRLDLQGVLVTSVTGCVSKAMKVSHTLKAIGLSDQEVLGTVLMGVNPADSPERVDGAIEKIQQAVKKLRAMSPAWRNFQA